MLDPQITVVGNVGAEPRTRVLADGAVVTDFRIASTGRKKDRDGQWTDRETIWFGVSCWRATAENVAASLSKGDRVVVSGRLVARSWVTDEGEKRSGLEIEQPVVGLDLSRGRASYERSAPLHLTDDPGYRSTGVVETESGKVLLSTGVLIPAEHDDDGGESESDEDEVSLRRVDALA